MKLFLTSSGISFEQKDIFLSEFSKSPKDIKFYFIPTAADVEPDGQSWVTLSIEEFAEMGINPIWYSLKYKTKEQISIELADADCVWVNGGNTFYLLDIAHKTGFYDVISDLVRNKGVVYGGTSAGSILAGKSIESAGWKPEGDSNDVGITDLTGLNFAQFIPFVHYKKLVHEASIKQIKNSSDIVYAISDDAFIKIINDSIELIGDIEIYES
jgi:dipeptidase E